MKSGDGLLPALSSVQTEGGALRGAAERGYTVFRGVPYAAPPVGALRFRPPQPAAPWPGVRSADAFPPIAPQAKFALGSFYHREFYSDEDDAPTASEDCLCLNVWTPAEDAGARLPVAVWIHGGALRHGLRP